MARASDWEFYGRETTNQNQNRPKVIIMQINRITAVLSLLALLGSAGLSLAADRYHFNLSVTGKTTNEVGNLVTVSTTSSRLIREIAEENDVPSSSLAMIYER